MKKLIITIIILLILISTGYYFVVEKDLLGLEKDKTEIIEIESFDINRLDNQIFSDKGLISYSSKTVRLTKYDGESWSVEIDEMIDKVYNFDYIYVLSNNRRKITELDNNGNILNNYEFEEEILGIHKETIVFLTARREDGSNIIIKIDNDEMRKTEVEGSIAFLSPKKEIDSYLISYFNFNEESITSTVQQRLIKDDIKLWENTLNNEIAVDAFKTNNRTFVLTDKNFYSFNTDGIILWKYSNFNLVEDIKIDNSNNKIYILEKTKLHILDFDSTVLKIVNLNQNFDKLKISNEMVLISSNSEIVELKDEPNVIWKNEELLKNYYIYGDNIYIETDYNIYIGKITGR